MSDPVLELSFFAGLDEATRDELVEPGQGWPVLENVRQDRRGAVSKRLGYASLGQNRLDASTRTAGNRLLSHKGLACTIDGTHLDAYDEAGAVSVVASRVPEASVETRTLSASGTGLYSVAECNGYIATATLSLPLSIVVGVDAANSGVVRPPEVVTFVAVTESTAALTAYGEHFVLLISDSSTTAVAAFALDTSTDATLAAGWINLGNVATDKTTSGLGAMALSAQGLPDRVAFAYVNNSGGTSQLTVKSITVAGVLETRTVPTTSTQPTVVSVVGSIEDTLWLAWDEGASVKLLGLDADALDTTLATVTTPFGGTFDSTGAPPYIAAGLPGAGRIAINTTSTGASYASPTVPVWSVASFSTVGGAGVATTPENVFGISMRAHPVMVGDRFYGLFHGGDADNGCLVLGDFTHVVDSNSKWIRPVAHAFPNLAILFGSSRPLKLSPSRLAYAVHVQRSAAGRTAELLTFDFADSARWRAAEHSGSLALAGGLLSYFDGRRVAEVGFLHSPAPPVAADSGSGTGVTGPVRYVATFEEVDGDGNWCVSGVSLPSQALSVSNKVVTVNVQPLVITGRVRATTDPRIRVSLHRTTSSGEPPYYFVGEKVSGTGGHVTFSDALDDAALESRRLLYGTGNLPGTNGGAQDRRVPPFCQDVVSYNGMLVVASGSTLWWSGQAVDGEGTWFSPAFVVPVEGDGYVTALAAQDGSLVVFKRQAVYTVAGEAPSDNGSFGGLGTPRRLACDVGCIDPRSVVVTSLGVFFLSERGIELLSPGGTVAWIGEKVQATLESYPVVSSAVLDDRAGLVRFTLATSESGGRVADDEGRDLVFDLAMGAWQSVDSKSGTGAREASQDAAMVVLDGARRYAWLGTNGVVHYERAAGDDEAHFDNGAAWIPQRAVSPWVAIAGRNGEQFVDQLLLLCKRHTDHDVTLSVAFDFSETYANSKTFTAAQLGALARQWLVREITQTTSQAVRVKIEDAAPTSGSVGTGQGATWIALSFNGKPHRGPKRSSGAQRGE